MVDRGRFSLSEVNNYNLVCRMLDRRVDEMMTDVSSPGLCLMTGTIFLMSKRASCQNLDSRMVGCEQAA